MVTQKIVFTESVQDALVKFYEAVDEIGFFDDPIEIPEDCVEQAKTNLWNIAGEELLSKFISGAENYLFTEDEVNKILINTIIQTNLDSLMQDKLVDGIENENGTMVYWLTEKGKEVNKSLDQGDITN